MSQCSIISSPDRASLCFPFEIPTGRLTQYNRVHFVPICMYRRLIPRNSICPRAFPPSTCHVSGLSFVNLPDNTLLDVFHIRARSNDSSTNFSPLKGGQRYPGIDERIESRRLASQRLELGGCKFESGSTARGSKVEYNRAHRRWKRLIHDSTIQRPIFAFVYECLR